MKKLITIFCCVLLLVCKIHPFEIALGLGWPYIGLKFNFLEKFSLEPRFASSEGINVFALRSYWDFHRYKRLKNFVGLEFGYVNFDTLGLTGNGYETGLFLGSEYFIIKNLSLCCDLSSVFINLSHKTQKVDSIEFVFNLAIYWYFYSK